MPFDKEEQQPLAVLIDRGQALMDAGKWREALKPLRQALVIEPENGEACCRISFAWLQLGDFEQALDYANRAVQNEPMNEWGHRLRSLALLKLGRKSDALAPAEEAVRLAPYWPHTFYVLAEAQIANQRLNEAMQTALRAREIAPEAPEVFKQLSPDVQTFIRAERRRESGYHIARLVCSLSAVILMWWIAIRFLNPSGPIFPRSATVWAIFAGLWSCFGASAAILVRRATSSHTSLWKWFLGLESNS